MITQALVAAGAAIDLSEPLPLAETYNANGASCALDALFTETQPKLAYGLLHRGALVAKRFGVGMDDGTKFNQRSMMHSWLTMLVGCLVDANTISASDTLDQVFHLKESDWARVTHAGAKRKITIDKLLTMESGLLQATSPPPLEHRNELVDVLNRYEMAGNATAAWAPLLSQCPHGRRCIDELEEGTFPHSYLPTSDIIVWHIISAASGTTPQQFARSSDCPVWAALGIPEAEVEWRANASLEIATPELEMKLSSMLKLGQLHLQGGLSAPASEQDRDFDNRLLSKEWMEATTTAQTQLSPLRREGAGPCGCTYDGYGQGWWICRDFYCSVAGNGSKQQVDAGPRPAPARTRPSVSPDLYPSVRSSYVSTRLLRPCSRSPPSTTPQKQPAGS